MRKTSTRRTFWPEAFELRPARGTSRTWLTRETYRSASWFCSPLRASSPLTERGLGKDGEGLRAAPSTSITNSRGLLAPTRESRPANADHSYRNRSSGSRRIPKYRDWSDRHLLDHFRHRHCPGCRCFVATVTGIWVVSPVSLKRAAARHPGRGGCRHTVPATSAAADCPERRTRSGRSGSPSRATVAAPG